MDSQQILQQAALSFSEGNNLVSSDKVVTALLAAEKKAKKQKINYSFEQLLGTWRLCFITGTKKTRKRAGIALGAGRYLPQLITITITYKKSKDSASNRGKVENCVDLKLLKLSLTGPIKFLTAEGGESQASDFKSEERFTPQNILAFDFTRMHLELLGITLYDGYIRSGAAKEASFDTDSIKQQAFFTYFFIDKSAIAARGRGGGLALWTSVTSVDI